MERGAGVVESVTTDDVAGCDRAEYWNEVVSSYHRRMDHVVAQRQDFVGRTTRRRTAVYQLVEWESDAVTYRRTAGHVRADSDDDYRLLLLGAGQITLHALGRSTDLRPGTACVMTMDSPFVFAHEHRIRALVMTVPRQEVDRGLACRAPITQQLDLTSGLGRVLGDLVTALSQEQNALTDLQFDAVSHRLVELLCMLVAGDDRPTAPGHLAEVEAAVRRYVREHADSADLSGAAIAHALGWSLRQVQLALQHAGTTPRDLIREERLQLAYTRLQSPACARWSVTALAHALGFSSVSAFSTAFRQRFGSSPREIRGLGAAAAQHRPEQRRPVSDTANAARTIPDRTARRP